MSRVPQEPQYEEGEFYPSRDAADLDELLGILAVNFSTAAPVLKVSAGEDIDEVRRLESLLGVLGRRRAELSTPGATAR